MTTLRPADAEGVLEAVRWAVAEELPVEVSGHGSKRGIGRPVQTQYGIDLSDRSIYDLTLNSARWSPEGTLSVVLAAVEAYDPAVDEGTTPTPPLDV